MKSFFYLAAIIFSSTNLILAQWYIQESNTTANLNGVWFVDSLNGWVCGDNGIILNTTNGGENWLMQTSTVNLKLKDVFFRDLQQGWIAGDSGTVLHTVNGGSSWNIQQTPVTSSLNHIQLSTSQNGGASGEKGTLIITYDGGTTWQAMPNYDTTTSVSFFWIDSVRGTISFTDSSGGSQYYTLNGGIAWGLSVPPFFDVNDIWGYRIWEPPYHIDHYWDVGEKGKILNLFVVEETMNYYATIGQTTDSLDLNAVTLERSAEDLKLWAVGKQGWIINSVDSGLTWQIISSSVQNNLNEVSFPANNLGWIVGDGGLILCNHLVTLANNSTVSSSVYTYLSNPYPNPFNPSTKISYQIAEECFVTLTVYNILGREVSVLVNEVKSPGTYMAEFNTETSTFFNKNKTAISGGIYFLKLQAGNYSQTRKVILLK